MGRTRFLQMIQQTSKQILYAYAHTHTYTHPSPSALHMCILLKWNDLRAICHTSTAKHPRAINVVILNITVKEEEE